MPRWSLERPSPEEVKEALGQVVSITALARHYHVTFTTAKKWIIESGLEEILSDETHQARIRKLELESSPRARQRRIDDELERLLKDHGDRKLVARAIVDEFSMCYSHKKCYDWERFALKLTLVMYDFPPVEEVARLVGVPWYMRFRKAKSGVTVPYWMLNVMGHRAFRVLQLTRPYLKGQKAFQSDIALQTGPFALHKVHLGKAVYKRNLFSSFGMNNDVFRGKGAGT